LRPAHAVPVPRVRQDAPSSTRARRTPRYQSPSPCSDAWRYPLSAPKSTISPDRRVVRHRRWPYRRTRTPRTCGARSRSRPSIRWRPVTATCAGSATWPGMPYFPLGSAFLGVAKVTEHPALLAAARGLTLRLLRWAWPDSWPRPARPGDPGDLQRWPTWPTTSSPWPALSPMDRICPGSRDLAARSARLGPPPARRR